MASRFLFIFLMGNLHGGWIFFIFLCGNAEVCMVFERWGGTGSLPPPISEEPLMGEVLGRGGLCSLP